MTRLLFVGHANHGNIEQQQLESSTSVRQRIQPSSSHAAALHGCLQSPPCQSAVARSLLLLSMTLAAWAANYNAPLDALGETPQAVLVQCCLRDVASSFCLNGFISACILVARLSVRLTGHMQGEEDRLAASDMQVAWDLGGSMMMQTSMQLPC